MALVHDIYLIYLKNSICEVIVNSKKDVPNDLLLILFWYDNGYFQLVRRYFGRIQMAAIAFKVGAITTPKKVQLKKDPSGLIFSRIDDLDEL